MAYEMSKRWNPLLHIRTSPSLAWQSLRPSTKQRLVWGLVFTTSPERSWHADGGVEILAYADFLAQMRRTLHVPDAWWEETRRCRFSLSGNQAKFTYSEIAGRRLWPSTVLPSTHIVKPDGEQIPDVAIVEASTMQIARDLGYDVADISTTSNVIAPTFSHRAVPLG